MSASTRGPNRMDADAFLTWSEQRPEKHYELCDGLVVEKTAERVVHAQAKVRIAARMLVAIETAGLDCQVFSGETAIRATDLHVYEPDAVVRRGAPLDGDTLYVLDPMIVVEIHSPSTSRVDATQKFASYFAMPTVRHYLLVDATARRVIHHARRDDGPFMTTLLGDGPVHLDPPGFVISNLFAPA